MPGSDRVVVIDTNFGSRSHFKLDQLRQLAERLSSRGHSVVVPEVVVWEWAEHAHGELAAARAAIDHVVRRVDSSLGVALPTIPPVDVENLARQIRSQIDELPPVELLATDDQDAVDAIAQQVLQTGVGMTEHGVKTGAADALILSTAERLLDDHVEVVLASNDAALGEVAEEFGIVVARTQHDLWNWFGLTQPPTNALASSIHAFVEQQINEAIALDGQSPLLTHGEHIGDDVFEAARFETLDVRQTDIKVEALEHLTLDDVEVVEDDEQPHLAVATVTARSVVFLVNWFIGGFDAKLIDETSSEPVEISVPITVELDETWEPVTFDADDRAEIRMASDYDSQDA